MDCKIAILGEAPGSSEDATGQPFIGSAGTLLRYMLKEVGINPSTVTYLNAVSCYPRLIQNPRRPHIDACRIWARGQIALINPTYLITVGQVALKSIRDTVVWPKLMHLNAKPLHWPNPPSPSKPKLWPLYHPAAALRSAKYKRLLIEGLRAFQQWRRDDEPWPEVCSVCGDELYRWDEWQVPLCERHAARQGILWPEDELPQSVKPRKQPAIL